MLVAIASADQCNKSKSVEMRQRSLYVSLVPGWRVRSRFRSDGRSERGLRAIFGMLGFNQSMQTRFIAGTWSFIAETIVLPKGSRSDDSFLSNAFESICVKSWATLFWNKPDAYVFLSEA